MKRKRGYVSGFGYMAIGGLALAIIVFGWVILG